MGMASKNLVFAVVQAQPDQAPACRIKFASLHLGQAPPSRRRAGEVERDSRKTMIPIAGDRGFEPRFLQRRVACEPEDDIDIPSLLTNGRSGGGRAGYWRRRMNPLRGWPLAAIASHFARVHPRPESLVCWTSSECG